MVSSIRVESRVIVAVPGGMGEGSLSFHSVGPPPVEENSLQMRLSFYFQIVEDCKLSLDCAKLTGEKRKAEDCDVNKDLKKCISKRLPGLITKATTCFARSFCLLLWYGCESYGRPGERDLLSGRRERTGVKKETMKNYLMDDVDGQIDKRLEEERRRVLEFLVAALPEGKFQNLFSPHKRIQNYRNN
ncbi:hypothetical protein RUM44_003539 [Polyplax serrata]|uniref:Uncharacterized protein n=1 Tax=Polyplax serrata TaxID=468196 RepID=A0ABR1AGR0_POLSC